MAPMSLACAPQRLPTIELFDLDTGQGKRSTFLDLGEPADAETLRRLAREAHVFVDSYRPGALAGLGFSPEALAHLSPGIVHVAHRLLRPYRALGRRGRAGSNWPRPRPASRWSRARFVASARQSGDAARA